MNDLPKSGFSGSFPKHILKLSGFGIAKRRSVPSPKETANKPNLGKKLCSSFDVVMSYVPIKTQNIESG